MEKDKASIIQNRRHSLQFLDALRGIAALYVMISHAKWLLWEGYYQGFIKDSARYSVIEKISVYALSIFKYNHQAVIFFFVLSGFVIHLKYSKNIATYGDAGFSVKKYLVKRIKRIYPPFLLSMAITFILDGIGSHLNYTIYYGATPDNIINTIITKQHDLVNFIGNLFFIQNEYIGVWGTNGPSWSLKYEWWFYMLYPILIYINKKSVLNSLLAVTALFIVSNLVPNLVNISFFIVVLKYLALWWLGAVLADVYNKRIPINHHKFCFLVFLFPLLIIIEILKINIDFFANDFLWALGFFGLLNLFFYLQEKGFVFSWTMKLQWLGDCSYTLYIIHFPILVFLNGVILHYTNNSMPRSLVFIFPGIVISFVFAYLLHFIVEKPFTTKR